MTTTEKSTLSNNDREQPDPVELLIPNETLVASEIQHDPNDLENTQIKHDIPELKNNATRE